MEKPEKFEERQEEYIFSGLRFFPNKWQIEISGTEKSVSLTKIQREFLLSLVKNANQVVSYEDLRKVIWSHEPVVDARVIHNMHVTKSKLINLLDDLGVEPSIIESIEGTGYRFNAEVVTYPTHDESSGTDEQKIPLINETISTTGNMSETFGTSLSEVRLPVIKPFSSKKLILGAVAAVISIFLIWQIGLRFYQPAMRLEKAEFVSNPIPGVESSIHLEGANFAPETVRLKVRGPGCGGDDPCIVSNGALRLHGEISETAIEKAPLKLAHGIYQIWLENEPGYISNQLTITMPENSP